MTTSISAGTVTVANGGTTVTGTDTFWIGKVFEGDLFTDPAQGLFARVTADAASNTALSINAWPGTALADAAYEVILQADSIRMSERTRKLLEALSMVEPNYDAQVADLPGRAAYDDELGPTGGERGFAVLVSNVGDGRSAIYSKLSNASGDWSAPAYLTGPAITLAVTEVDDVPYGTPPDVNMTARAGGYDLAFDIPRGMIIVPGTTTTLAPDQPAAVTFVPVTGGYRLDIAIPRGPTGDIDGVTPFWVSRLGSDADAAAARKGLGRDYGVNIKTLGVMGDNATDDRAAIIQALIDITALGKTVIVPEGTYLCSGWIPLPDKLKIWFAPGAIWKLTANTPGQGHFLCGGYLLDGTQVPFTDAEIWNLTLDCNNIAGENAMAAINGDGVRLYSPKIYRTRHSPSTLGGRAFQFEGASITGIDVYSPYIEDCSIGINSHADPLGATEIVRGVHYWGVSMKNVDIPFNIDGRFVNPQSGTKTNMSSFVHGAALEDCGKPRWTGGPGSLQGAIITSDRGMGLSIDGLRLVNTAAYGKIGSFVRGQVFDLRVTNAELDCAAGMNQLVNFNPITYSGAAITAFASRMHVEVDVRGPMGVIATADDVNGIGRTHIDLTYGSDTSLAGLFDNFAASSESATARITYRDAGQTISTRSFASLFETGNSIVGLLETGRGLERLHHRKQSVASGVNTAIIKIAMINGLRVSIDYVMTVQMPNSSSRGVLVAKGTALAAITDSGVLMQTILDPKTAYSASGIASWTGSVSVVDLGDGTFALAINQTNDIGQACTVSLQSNIDCSLGATARQPKVTRL